MLIPIILSAENTHSGLSIYFLYITTQYM